MQGEDTEPRSASVVKKYVHVDTKKREGGRSGKHRCDRFTHPKMLRPLGGGEQSWSIQCFSSLRLSLRAWIVGGGRWMNSITLMLTFPMPIWSSFEK